MSSVLSVKVKGFEKLKGIDSRKIGRYLMAARVNITDEILSTEGLKKYPPASSGNMPPPPYYIRGRGTQVSYSRNLKNSERLGSQWKSKLIDQFGSLKIWNDVSYAHYVHGEQSQSDWMAARRWRKLFDVAKEKAGDIAKIYSRFMDKMIRDSSLD